MISNALAFELYWTDDSQAGAPAVDVEVRCPDDPAPRPVLFVHGHCSQGSVLGIPLSSCDPVDDQYVEAWRTDDSGTSFKSALEAPENESLGIEDYYLEFDDLHDRSIVLDAKQVGEAIAQVQACQNPGNPTAVKVALVAYSKGTISSRLYLRSVQEDLTSVIQGAATLDPPMPGYLPVSEFVAIASPNHGLRAINALDDELPVRQLNNGVSAPVYLGPILTGGCDDYQMPEASGFMSALNGVDGNDQWNGAHETPGGRMNGDPVANGTLFVSIYATGNRDLVGGADPFPEDDCTAPPRKQARNLGAGAVNLAAPVLPGASGASAPAMVHAASVHDFKVICAALHTVFHHRAPTQAELDSAAGLCAQAANGAPVVMTGTAVTLALDLSGSMLARACPSCPPIETKLWLLQNAVEEFINQWSALQQPLDRISVTYFRSNVAPLAPPMRELGSDAPALIAEVTAQMTSFSEMTAMGGGLYSALRSVRGDGRNRHVILFTDGMQNVNPMVEAIPSVTPAEYQLVDDPVRPASNVVPLALPFPLARYPGVKFDVIGIGTGPAFEQLLHGIAGNSGLSQISTDLNMLSQFFTNALVDTLRDSSPQLVDYRYARLEGDAAIEDFIVNSGARRILLKLAWRRDVRLNFRVEKDGEDLTGHGRFLDGRRHRLFVLPLPVAAGTRTIEAGGTWRMRISGASGTDYEVSAIVDEPDFEYRVSLGDRDYRAGEPIELEVRLQTDGLPPATDAEVTATVRRPAESAANLLAAYPARAEPVTVAAEPTASPGQIALAELLRDDAMWKRLQPIPSTLALANEGNGRYRATFADTQIPGSYTVTFTIEAQDSAGGTIRRVDTASTQVRFAGADLQASDLRVHRLATTDRGEELELSLRPRDRFGNMLGPDFGRTLSVSLSNGAATSTPRDLGNGRYVFPIVIPTGVDADVEIRVGDVSLSAGPLSGLIEADEEFNWQLLTALFAALMLLVFVVLFLLVRRRVQTHN